MIASLKPLFKRRQSSAAVPVGQAVYAVGDIHGQLDLLDGLLDRVVRLPVNVAL